MFLDFFLFSFLFLRRIKKKDEREIEISRSRMIFSWLPFDQVATEPS